MKTIICLSGLAGSGKSAIGIELANRLNCPFHSIGNFTREYAHKLNMDINQFQAYAAITPGLDEKIDQAFIAKINLNHQSIVDFRLGFKFLKNAHHVLLKVDPMVAVERIINRKIKSDGQMEELNPHDIWLQIMKRNASMISRFQSIYKVDFTEETNYDLIIDTSSVSIEASCEEIFKFIYSGKIPPLSIRNMGKRSKKLS